jgi:hypothetical protein
MIASDSKLYYVVYLIDSYACGVGRDCRSYQVHQRHVCNIALLEPDGQPL